MKLATLPVAALLAIAACGNEFVFEEPEIEELSPEQGFSLRIP